MNIKIWRTAKRAKEIGATHHARIYGIIPGFFAEDENLWVPRSDLLNPLEDLLGLIWDLTRILRGEEPDFMFYIGREISTP